MELDKIVYVAQFKGLRIPKGDITRSNNHYVMKEHGFYHYPSYEEVMEHAPDSFLFYVIEKRQYPHEGYRKDK